MDVPYDKAPERVVLDKTAISDSLHAPYKMQYSSVNMPAAWFDLMQAIALMAKHQSNEIRPFQCSHDQLYVCSDDTKFTNEEIQQLEEWGFYVSGEGGFYSFKYGSA